MTDKQARAIMAAILFAHTDKADDSEFRVIDASVLSDMLWQETEETVVKEAIDKLGATKK